MARTAAQARKERRDLVRELKKAETQRHKAKIQALRDEEKRAKLDRREKLALARQLCKENAIHARAVADAAWQKARAAALEARRAKKQAAREGCELSKEYIRRCAEEKAARARAERLETIRFRKELARLEASAKQRAPRVSRQERRSESDDAVRANIPDRLLPLWEESKRSIRATERWSRTEAFLHYAEEHPTEVLDAQERAAAKSLKREIAARYKEEKAERRRALSAEVPF